MLGKVEAKWENDPDSFEKLPKEEFDKLCQERQFIMGPIVSSPSKWASEFGSYNPNRWAFGKLSDGRFVCCNITGD